MRQYKWKVSLIRDKEIVAKKEVYEFDGECLNQNLWSKACQEFANVLQDKDIIRVEGNEVEYIQYNAATGEGIIL